MNKKIANNNANKGENTMKKNLNTTAITNALVNLGFKNVEVVTVTKNGVNKTGIRYMPEGSNVSPVVYIDDCKNETDAVECCRHLFNKPIPNFNNPLENPDISRIKAYICGKGKSGTDVTRSWLDLEIYAVYDIPMKDGHGSIRIKSEYLPIFNMTADEILDTAIANSMKDCNVVGIQKMIAKLQGVEIPPIENDFMYVLTSNDYTRGAINILNTDAIKDLAKRFNDDLYIMPSSIHEVLAVPVSGKDPDEVRAIVGFVNGTEVIPEELLSDSIYIYNRKNGKVAIA